MINKIYNLYKRNLPDIVRGEETVRRILSDKTNHFIFRRAGDDLIGVSVINKNTIYLLCVDKTYQKQGIGSDLLIQSEKHILSNGYTKIVTGTGKDYIMPGVPMNDNAHMFFQKRGYIHSWSDIDCFDMEMMLKDFNCNDYSAGDMINGIMYRWATIKDIEKIILCVSDAEEKFVKYYRNESFYQKDSVRPILIAEKNDEILGAIMLYVDFTEDMGSVGCTATMTKHRNKGIATNMVKLGTKHLKDIGLSRACLGYTYTQIVHMYSRAGYKVSMKYFMGEKEVINPPCV